MITLYRGDDTTFKGVKRLRVTIESKESLAGCSATFEVCGVVKHVPDVSTGSFYLSLTGEDTAKMPLGTHTATLRVYDDESRRRTVANTIMVCVTERIGDAYPGEEDIAVSLGAMVAWRNVSDKPSVNGVVLEGNKTTKELGIKGVVEATLVDLPEDYTPEGLRAAVNAINACLRASMACAAVAACALFAPCAAWAENGEAEASEGETAAEATEDEAATDGEAPSRVTVREFGDMTSMNKQFKALSNLTAVVTAVDLDGLATDDALDTLKGKVDAEAAARHDADTNLTARVDALATSLSEEATSRADGDKANADYTTAVSNKLEAAVAGAISRASITTNGVVVVDGEKSAALDAGEARTLRAENNEMKDIDGHSPAYLQMIQESQPLGRYATTDGETLFEGDSYYIVNKTANGWAFSSSNAVDICKTGETNHAVIADVNTSFLVPDNGRVLTTAMLPVYRGKVEKAYRADNADNASKAISLVNNDAEITGFSESATVGKTKTTLYGLEVKSVNAEQVGTTVSKTNFVSRLVADGTDFVTEKTLGEELAANGYTLSPTPALTEEQTARGLTYEKNGIMQDGAVQIGRHAVATIDPAFVENAPSGTILRSVSVAVGDYANARADGKSKSQSVAIGWFSQAKGGNSIAIGSGAQHTNETAMSGGATVATGASSIALGYTAKATANNSVQIGIGTNSTPNSLQFQNVPIVRDGKLAVDGTINTNDVEAIIDAYLAPRSVEELPSDGVLKVRSHAITTFAPTNAAVTLDEVIAEATATRNYEIYIPNVAATRESLPLNFDTEDASLTKVGPWWGRKALRLPALVKVREPTKDTVILGVETYDDGWDWTPVVTNAEWEATEDGAARRLKKVRGYNLQGVTAVRVAYEGTDGATNVVASTAVGNALYGTVWPTIADIAEADIAAGTEVVVSVVAESVSAPKATLNALTESVTEILKSEKEGWR